MTTFGSLIVSFFRNYLANQKGYSPNTIASYSDCIRLLLSYSCDRLALSFDKLPLDMITDHLILDFLDHLEQNRHNAPRTRNQRLAAIKTFFRFLALQDPTVTATCERICSISAKKIEHKLIGSLENHEVQAIINSVDPSSLNSARDQALFTLLYNTGARVQELVDLDVSDLRLEAPLQVLLTGKGQKQRVVPLYEETVATLQHYLKLRHHAGINQDALFLNSSGKRITRFGISHIIAKYTAQAAKTCPSLADKNVTPHAFRHTTALHMIQSGVDITVIKEWLGHADIKTTSQYTNINMEMKRKALEACPPPSVSLPDTTETPQWQNPSILLFLQKLSRQAALC